MFHHSQCIPMICWMNVLRHYLRRRDVWETMYSRWLQKLPQDLHFHKGKVFSCEKIDCVKSYKEEPVTIASWRFPHRKAAHFFHSVLLRANSFGHGMMTEWGICRSTIIPKETTIERKPFHFCIPPSFHSFGYHLMPERAGNDQKCHSSLVPLT